MNPIRRRNCTTWCTATPGTAGRAGSGSTLTNAAPHLRRCVTARNLLSPENLVCPELVAAWRAAPGPARGADRQRELRSVRRLDAGSSRNGGDYGTGPAQRLSHL